MDNLLDTNDQVQDPPKDYWEELTGPGKKFDRTKYADDKELNQALARGKYEADMTIVSRNRENEQLRKDYLQLDAESKAGPKLQELMDQLIEKRLASSDNNPNANEVNDKPEIDLTKIESLISNKISANEIEKIRQDNYKLVEAKLKERYGDNFSNVLKKQVEDLGETSEYVNDLARRNPKLFFKTFGLDQPIQSESFQAPLQTTQRQGDPFTPTSGPKRTWAYYQKLKKEKPSEYLHPRTQDQMQKDAIALGDEFKDGNYSTLA